MDRFQWRISVGYIILGVVAAFVVPLFLNMISSNLLDTGQTRPLNLFVLCGFCLLAAVFSRSFLANMYSRIVRQINELKKKADREEDRETEPDETKDGKDLQSAIMEAGLSDNDANIMKVIAKGKYTYRSLTGIVKDSGLPKEIVKHALDILVTKRLIAQIRNRKGRILWYLQLRERN